MKFARAVFMTAGVYGLVVMTPQLFLESKTSHDYPPAITHPEFYYGFVGTVIAWQIAFLVIARDPVRFRPLMWAGVVEKAAFAVAVPLLYVQHRVAGLLLLFSSIDTVLGILFVLSWLKTKPAPQASASTKLVAAEDDALISDLGRAMEQSRTERFGTARRTI